MQVIGASQSVRMYLAEAKMLLSIINQSRVDQALMNEWLKRHRMESHLKRLFIVAVQESGLNSRQVQEISRILHNIVRNECIV